MVVFLKFLAVASLLFAIVMFGYAVPLYIQQNRILHTWPPVDAVVVSSRILEHPTPSGSLYATELQFSFAVNGNPITGAFVFPHESTSRERKQKQTDQYPVGSHHRILFNPGDPSEVRINPGYNVDFFVIPVFLSGVASIFVVLAGAFWGMAAWRKWATRGTI